MIDHPPGSDHPPSAEPVWKRALRIAFLLAATLAAGLLLTKEWDGISASLAAADPALVVLAALAATTNVVLTGISWRALLAQAPVTLDLRTSAHVFFVGQIGKYLPGTVWSFLASGELALKAGLPRIAAMSSLLLALLIGLGTGVLVALVTVPQTLGIFEGSVFFWVLAGTVAVAMLHPKMRAVLLRAVRIDFPIALPAFWLSVGTALLAWVLAGIHILLLAKAVGVPLGWEDLPTLIGAYAFAWIAGFLVFFSPAGLGAREGGLLAMLTVSIGLAEATAIVVLSRLAITVADFGCAAGALLFNQNQAFAEAGPPPHRG